MEWLFSQLFGLYGNPFLDKFRSGHVVSGKDSGIENAKAIWREKITESRLSAGDIKRGIDGCDRLKFPPSWAEFLALCKPAMDPLVAYYEAVAGVQARKSGQPGAWSHPAIYWAAMPMAHDLLSSPFSTVKVRWERALEQQMAKGTWEAIPEPALALEAPGKGNTTPERAQQAIRGLQSMSMTSTGKDPKAWAHRIMERERRGDKGLTTLQVQFAREALGC